MGSLTKFMSIIAEEDPCDYNHRWNLAKRVNKYNLSWC